MISFSSLLSLSHRRMLGRNAIRFTFFSFTAKFSIILRKGARKKVVPVAGMLGNFLLHLSRQGKKIKKNFHALQQRERSRADSNVAYSAAVLFRKKVQAERERMIFFLHCYKSTSQANCSDHSLLLALCICAACCCLEFSHFHESIFSM